MGSTLKSGSSMKGSMLSLIRKSTMGLEKTMTMKKGLQNFINRQVVEKIDNSVPLAENNTPLSNQAVIINEKIEEFRVKKELEFKVKNLEEQKRKQFQEALS